MIVHHSRRVWPMEWGREIGYSPGIWAAMVAILIFLGRLVFVALYAESIPYWDQWDAEGAYLFKPWVDGSWRMADLFAAHNEHRIAFTRLISLLVFEANQQQWDNRVLAFANVAIYSGVSALLFLVLARGHGSTAARGLLAMAIVLLGWLPYGHTNSLVGFQNQFYLMTGFAIATIAVAASSRDCWPAYCTLAILSLLGLFTMASGLLAAVVAGALLVFRTWQGGLRVRPVIAMIMVLMLIAVGGYLLIPHIPGHDTLKAPDAVTWGKAFLLHLGWPLKPSLISVLILWLPSMIAAWRYLSGLNRRPDELIALGLAGWVVLQCAAIAYSRGSEGNVVGERYVDILALGLLANAWLALGHAAPPSWSMWRKAAGRMLALCLYCAIVLLSLARHVPGDLAQARYKHAISLIQTENVRRFVQSGNPAQLDQPFMHIPYPDAKRLASLLSDPALRSALPVSVRAPMNLTPPRASDGFANGDPQQGFAMTSCAGRKCAAATGEWRSGILRSDYHWLYVPMAVGGGMDGLSVLLESGSGSSVANSMGLVEVPDNPFQLVVRDQAEDGWISFDVPREAATLSAWALQAHSMLRHWFNATPEEAHWLRRPVLLQSKDMVHGKALRVDDTHPVQGRFLAPRTGHLDSFSVFIGNYGGGSSGVFHVRLCARTGCTDGRTDLAHSIDNMYFFVSLPEGLYLQAGETVVFSLRTEGSGHPVALWTYPPDGSEAPRLDMQAPSEHAGRVVRAGVGFRE